MGTHMLDDQANHQARITYAHPRSPRRFGYGTLLALLVLIATGTAMAFHLELWSNGTFHVKLALVAAVGALLVWHIRRSDLHILEGIIFLLSLAIVWLGLYLANGYS